MPVGCFKKNPNSLTVIKDLHGNIDWNNIQLKVEECAKLVAQKRPRYKVFGLLSIAECYAGHTYKEMIKSEDCWPTRVGKQFTFFIYEFN